MTTLLASWRRRFLGRMSLGRFFTGPFQSRGEVSRGGIVVADEANLVESPWVG